jgi:predicted lysophospholipase L1 biosynthesis ABC-type transport system permease subunit
MGGPYLEGGTLEIVGVSGNVSQEGLDSTAGPEIFLPRAQDATSAMVIMVRASQDPAGLTAAVRRTVSALDRSLPIRSLHPFEETLSASLSRRRFGTLLLALFAGLAMLLAAVGICGLLNYWVSVREGEIAIRMILGASVAKIAGWTGAQALRLAAAGIAAGTLGAWFASRWLATLVFGVSARNPWMLLGSAGAVIALAILAAALPIYRAAGIRTAGRLRQL